MGWVWRGKLEQPTILRTGAEHVMQKRGCDGASEAERELENLNHQRDAE